ncbi:hypothetical protein ES703_14345 [subsurface metagenome]
MPILEHGSNFPDVLGRKNVPVAMSWPEGRRLSEVPSVRGIGRDQWLPQAGVDTDISVVADRESTVHNLLAKQLTKRPIVPLLDRPTPLINRIKARATLVRRTKLLGVLGIVNAQQWGPERGIGSLPKPMSILSGPEHPMHPSRTIAMEL